MQNLEIHASKVSNKDWLVEIYNPNVATIEQELTKQFSTAGETQVWLETFSKITVSNTESFWGVISHEDEALAQKMLAL